MTSWLRGSIGAVNTWDFDVKRLDMRQLMRRFFSTVKPRSTDTRLIRKPHYHGQFAMSLGKESPYIFSLFDPLNADPPLIRTLSMSP